MLRIYAIKVIRIKILIRISIRQASSEITAAPPSFSFCLLPPLYAPSPLSSPPLKKGTLRGRAVKRGKEKKK